jgi:1-acyl-sn-glycerol-3-phosphate acyltransferase
MSAAAPMEPGPRRRRASGARPAPPLPPATLASRPPSLRGRLVYMPRWARVAVTGVAFGVFFGGTSVLGLFAGLWYRFRRVRDEDRWQFTRSLNRGLTLFSNFMRDVGIIDYWPPQLPPGYEGKGFLLVANHPTLIDVVLVLGSLPQTSAVAKASWYRSFLMGPMLRRTEYVPGPGLDGEEDEDSPVLRRIEDKLRSGVPVLVFPEGTRSAATSLRRFRRGGIEAAIRAGVPILPLFIANDQPFLMKGIPFWKQVPKRTCGFTFEWFEPIETAGRELDSRAVTRELAERYEARFARLLQDRAALDVPRG